MGLMTGKRLLITGVITDQSIAYSVARLALAEGATVLLTGYGRMSLVERMAKRLGIETPVLELDATDSEQLASLAQRVGEHVDGLDGVLHAIAFGPQSTLGGGFMTATWADVATALHASTYSYQALAVACEPLGSSAAGTAGLGSGNGSPVTSNVSAGHAETSNVGADAPAPMPPNQRPSAPRRSSTPK